ncbi:MAG: PBP1A family penicillin-binding protein [Candidatus Binatia bacterium]
MSPAGEGRRRGLRGLPKNFLVLGVSALAVGVLLGGVVGWRLYIGIDETLQQRFAGRRWDFPSRIYSDEIAVYPGIRVDDALFRSRLASRGYRSRTRRPAERGEFRFVDSAGEHSQRRLELFLRPFDYPGRREKGRLLLLELDEEGMVTRISSAEDGSEVFSFFLAPVPIAGLHGELREERREMTIAEVPGPLIRAIINVEDRRFFEHRGVDLRGLSRAMLVNLRSGSVRQGGSTLTQQLMKNFFLTDERTLSRKLREAAMALVAERRFSKLEILENYINEIYLGQKGGVGVHGLWEAAGYYFGREPRELSMGQIATLAGMIRAPNYYSPHRHPERALERRDVVLKILRSTGDLDERAFRSALAEPLGTVPPPPTSNSAAHFTDFVRNELQAHFPREVLASEGYEIFTTLDHGLQRLAVEVLDDGLRRLEEDFPTLAQSSARLEGALVALNPRTGAIVAMVGGREYGQTQFNRVINGRRQTGSVFKPVVMLAALGGERVGSKHFLPSSRVMDEAFTWEYDGRSWTPTNYEEKYYGEVSVREALERSINSATARIAREVGIGPIRDLAVRLGADPGLPAYPAIALGAWELSPLEVAKIYGVFANAGMSAAPMSVAKVVDRRGRIVEGNRVQLRRVIPAEDAYLITHLLMGVMERGTGKRARRSGFTRPAAGKTGTTNDFNDAWFAGFTPDLLTVVWVGYDRKSHVGLSGAVAALPIWTEFMKGALAGRPPADFDVPAGVELVDIDPRTGLRASVLCSEVVTEAYLKGEGPSEQCGIQKHLSLPGRELL